MSARNFQILSSLDSFVEARALARGHLLIQGDSGGETFLTCPVSSVECGAENLFLLMLDLESLSQVCKLSEVTLSAEVPTTGYDAWIVCAEFDLGESYQGSEIRDDLWLNDQFQNFGIASDVRLILTGELDRLTLK